MSKGDTDVTAGGVQGSDDCAKFCNQVATYRCAAPTDCPGDCHAKLNTKPACLRRAQDYLECMVKGTIYCDSLNQPRGAGCDDLRKAWDDCLGGTTTVDDSACGKKTNQLDCINCCADVYPAAAKILTETEYACDCRADVCGKVCADYCSDPTTTHASCDSCIAADTCFDEAAGTCQADTNCAPLLACNQHNCQGLPK